MFLEAGRIVWFLNVALDIPFLLMVSELILHLHNLLQQYPRGGGGVGGGGANIRHRQGCSKVSISERCSGREST